MSYGYQGTVVGHDSSTNLIWFLGGYPNFTKILTFDPDNDTFSEHNVLLPENEIIQSHGQSYVTVGSLIYMNFVNVSNREPYYISTFDMSNQELILDFAIYPTYALRSAITYFDGYLIAIGGETIHPHDPINNCQILRLSDKYWFDGPDMSYNRSRFAANAVNNHLYAIGGRNAENIISKIYIGDIENINNYNWMDLNDNLSKNHTVPRTVVYDDDIYVIGGINVGIDVIHTANDTVLNNVNYLVTQVSNAAAVIANYKIYLFGGNTQNKEPWNFINTYQYAYLLTSEPTTQPTENPKSMNKFVFSVRISIYLSLII